MPNAYLRVEGCDIGGINAEIVSVLQRSSLPFDEATWTSIFLALDSETPHEDRVPHAIDAIQRIIRRHQLARWIPWYSNLPDHEYTNEYYPAYRDHTIHTLCCYLLGLYLYELVQPLRDHIDARLRTSSDVFAGSEAFREWWTLAAIWHDMAYPFETVEFFTNPDQRRANLDALQSALSDGCFVAGLTSIGMPADETTRRSVYQQGRFYPFRFQSHLSLSGDERANALVSETWQRSEVAVDVPDLLRRLDEVSSSAPRSRPPYHDHGLFGAALLSILAKEAKQFLTHLSDGVDSLPPRAAQCRDQIEDAYLKFEFAGRIIDDAIESIGYHNLNLDTLDKDALEATGIIRRGEARPIARLEREPHVFFLSLVDTLQDWERHHFAPNLLERRYRPATRPRDMHLQGRGGKLLLSLAGGNELETVRKLFAGWLDVEPVDTLFGTGAGYSLPEILHEVQAPPEAASRSAQVRERLLSSAHKTAAGCQEALVQEKHTAISRVATSIQAVTEEIRLAQSDLALVDLQTVETTVAAEFADLEKIAYALIQEGTQLPLGVVESKIGSGGFGDVFQVRDQATSRQYAFKLFHAHDLGENEKRRLFQRGFEAMKRLDGYPNIVSVHRFTKVPFGFFMDLIPGTDLSKAISTIGTTNDRIALALEIGQAISYAHNQGVLHRDIKPANVLLDARYENRPVLTDFDLAWIDGRTQAATKAQYATIQYGAPEQFDTGRRTATTEPTVDVYGFGALLYFMLTKHEPPPMGLWSESHWQVFADSLEGTIPAVALAQLKALILQATKVDPADRFQSFDVMFEELTSARNKCSYSDITVGDNAWLREVAFQASGELPETPPSVFLSRAGGIEWRGPTVRNSGDSISFSIQATLIRPPSYEGVNFRGFRKGSSRQIDARLRAFDEEWSEHQVRSRRRGTVSGVGHALSIEIDRLPRELRSAGAVGLLLNAIGRIIE